MRLLHCHIENFGKLHDADFDFKEGVTQFYEENGYGKTTLAAFLKAMFYGLPSYKTNAKTFNDRMHFYPFNGGKFGGNLTFEMGGKQYRIERFFDKKSDAADELKVFCAGRPYDFRAEVGKAVFGLDKESFERTAFFTEADTELALTSTIGEKLNRFVEDTENEAGFDDAALALEKAKKELKKRGGGRIDEMIGEIDQLTREIKNLEQISDCLPSYYARRNALQEEISAAQAKIKAAGEKNLVAEKWKHLRSLLERKEKLAAQADEIRENYEAGVPSREELARAKQELEKVRSLREFKKNFTFDEEKIARLQEYERVFREGVPNANELNQVKERIDELQRLNIKLSASENGKDERFLRLEQKFEGNLPDEKKEREIAATVEKYRSLQQSTFPSGTATPKKKSPLYLILAIVAVVIAAAGAGLLFVNTIAGGVLLGAGGVALGVVAFLYLKSQSAVTRSAESVKQAALLKEAEDAVREFLVPYGYYSQNGVVFDFSSFVKDKEEYLEARRKRHTNLTETGALTERYEALSEELVSFFRRYRIHDEDFASALVTLRQNIKDFASLGAQEREFEERQASSQREIESRLSTVKRLYEKYAFNETPSLEHIEQMSADSAELARLNKEAATLEREAQEYRGVNKLADVPHAEETFVAPMTERLHEAQRELAAVERQINDAEAEAEALMDKRAQKEVAEEELSRLKTRYEVISAALDALKTADRNLKDKYVSPVKDAFLEIAQEIESTLGERMSMDADFRITFERGGEQRSDKYLSAGQRSVCALAFRLALIKNMYEAEQPFLVLDDPFTALDETHFMKTAETLKVLARNMQIIYFCCHKSRTV